MDTVRASSQLLRVEHRHGDEWVRLEPSPAHDSAEGDPERQWPFARLFRCTTCEEEVRIDLDRDDRTPG